MTANQREGFTLIEVLIAIAVGSLIVALTWTAFRNVSQTSRRFHATTSLYQQASVIHAAVETPIGIQFHGAQFRLAVKDAGTRKAKVTLDCMYPLKDFAPDLGRTMPASIYYNDLTWSRLEWYAGGDSGPPTLKQAITPPYWTAQIKARYRGDCTTDPSIPAGAPADVVNWANEEVVPLESIHSSSSSWVTCAISPEPRRDRRRDINDNDLRMMPGIPAAAYASRTPASGLGDGDRLQLQLDLGQKLVSDRISRFRIEIIDFRGYRTVVNPTPGCYEDPAVPSGISYYDATGAAFTPPSPDGANPNVWSSSLRTVDGLSSEGRTDPCPGYASASLPVPQAERPAVIRIAFVLHAPITSLPIPANSDASGVPLKDLDFLEYDRRRPGGNTYISREFSFSFSTSSIGVQP